MRPSLFTKIVTDVEAHNHFFKQKYDASCLLGLLALQKVTAAMRMFATVLPLMQRMSTVALLNQQH